MNTCQTCGLPQDLCVCASIAKESQKIEVRLEKRKYGKPCTVIAGLEKEIDLKDLCRHLKEKLACGGTVKDSMIELQSKYPAKVKQLLVEYGFLPEMIIIKNFA
ncbi:stress response translation initiation inhibitor YciH [Candidatus Woesearchaeota archaeon]|nr:stress response translation initiation inhibitor YciH [Candidatus Woesearchaeota archaeon]